MTEHAVYPAGPPCQPNCPGPSSMYHDGYADGFERAEAEATAAAEQRLAGLREALRGLVDAHRLGREHRPCICAAHEDARRALLDPAPELVARTEEMLAALRGPASPRQGEPVELDEAWREAEATLPEAWFMGGLTNTSYRGDRERWLAQAYQGPEPDANYRVFKHGYGDTPGEALRALAAALGTPDTEERVNG